jgi:uncharacterized protein YndB with AHSA1/START domain
MSTTLRDPRTEPTDKLGAVGKLPDGRSFVYFERHLPYPVEKVWAAITESDQLARWFPGLTVELHEGGHFEIRFGGECEGPAHVAGVVTAYEPPHVFELGNMRYELQPEEHGCLLKFRDILVLEGSRSTASITNAVLGGWHNFLEALEAHLEGRTLPEDRPEFDYSVIREGRG